MSRQMVDHYMRFKAQIGIAADGRKRLKLGDARVDGDGPMALYRCRNRPICKTFGLDL